MCFKGSSATSVKNVLTRTFKSKEERDVQRVENPSRKRQNLGGLPRLGLLLFSDAFQPPRMLMSLHHVAYSLAYNKTKLSVYRFVQNLFPNKFQL